VSHAALVPPSFRLKLFERIGSTNDEALACARSGDPGGLWIMAREQTAGRGRQGRSWRSPRGNLYATLLLVDPGPVALAPQLGLVAGVALATAASDLVRHDRRLALKWPNDLLFARAKLAGVLLEGAQTPAGSFACALGFGLNCRHHPSGLAYPATDLAAIGRACDPADALEALAARVAEWLVIWDAGRGFARVRSAWLSFAAALGETVTVRTPQGAYDGLFQGLDAEGRLLLETKQGTLCVEAGDVFLAPQMVGVATEGAQA
jgi:BirA family transcriptional regulator, biotin operon repressor / biotin---[acetyl-CoA-carboxylase] ligase